MKRKVKLGTKCLFPKCEECEHYVSVGGASACNVPMVISKQEEHLMWATMLKLESKIKDLEEIVYSKL